MSAQHKSLKEEILFVIGRASGPLTSGEIYERCELADEMKQVSNALFQLKDGEKIERVEGDGCAKYRLPKGSATPAPAGKAGRQTAPVSMVDLPENTTGMLTSGFGVAPAALEIPTLGATPSPEDRKAADEAIAKGLDLVEEKLKAEHLADAILARLKRQLAPTLFELEAAAGMDRLNVHIHIEQVDVHLGGL